MEKQILIIYAGTKGYLDDMAVEECRPFEESLYKFVENAHPALLGKIRERKVLDDALQADINNVLREAKERFKTAAVAAVK